MTERDYQELREASWRRPLTAAEEARLQSYLAQHPEAQAEGESDTALNQLLDQVPDAPVSSNFTARVMQAIDREPTPIGSSWQAWWGRWVWSPVPRLAWAAVFMALAFLSYQHYQHRSSSELARGLVHFTANVGLSEPTIFQDFDAIQQLAETPLPTDEELWMVLNPSQNP